jgi:hypothetical protein
MAVGLSTLLSTHPVHTSKSAMGEATLQLYIYFHIY